MRILHYLLFAFFIISLQARAQISASGSFSMGSPPNGSAIDTIIIFTNSNGSITLQSADTGDFIWKYYKNNDYSGSSFTTQDSILVESDTTSSTLKNIQEGGYQIKHTTDSDTTISTIWVVIYDQHNALQIDTVIVDDSGDDGFFSPCDTVYLRTEISQDSFFFYSPPEVLSGPQRITNVIHYTSGEYLNNNLVAVVSPTESGPQSLGAYEIFQFLEGPSTMHYGNTSAQSEYYQAIALNSIIEADFSQSDNPPSNQIGSFNVSGKNYGVNVPTEMTLTCSTDNPSDYYSWKIYRLNNGEYSFVTSIDLNNFTFPINQADTLLVKLNVTNDRCEANDSIQVVAYSSLISAPNTFTPNGDGINDEFKVSYRSIKSFEGHIYNRWGKKVFSWTDPAQGWDGKVNGTNSPPGAYFYKIKVTGTQNGHNVSQSISGDINLIRPK